MKENYNNLNGLEKYNQYSLYGLHVQVQSAVTGRQPCTFENSSFHFHYALHFTFEEIGVKNRSK